VYNEFSLGFGPSIYQFKKGETVYSLRTLPVGAFVKFAGLDEPFDPNDTVKDGDPRSFRSNHYFKDAYNFSRPPYEFCCCFIYFLSYLWLPGFLLQLLVRYIPISCLGWRYHDRG